MKKHEKKPMNMTYVASFLDGEGSIIIGKCMKFNPVAKKRYPCTTIRMEICNTDFDIIKDIYKFMDTGHVIDIKPRPKKNGEMGKPQKRWQTTHQQTLKALVKLLPYMREKNKINKAMRVIKYYEGKKKIW